MVSELRARYPARAATRERNRDALLAAAAELAAERGYSRTSVDAVAQRAGLTKGAVYSIFGSKPGLFLALLTPQYGIPVLSEVAPVGCSLPEALEAYARHWHALATDEAFRGATLLALEIVVDALRADDGVLADLALAPRTAVERLAEEITAFAAGEPLARPADEIATGVVAALQGLTMMQTIGLAPVASVWAASVLGQLS